MTTAQPEELRIKKSENEEEKMQPTPTWFFFFCDGTRHGGGVPVKFQE